MADVTLIKRTTPVCPACNSMQAQLDGEGIEYNVIDITENPEYIDILGLIGVPVLLVEQEPGGEVTQLNGFQPIDKIKDLIYSGS